MPTVAALMGAGTPAGQASLLAGNTGRSLTAAGTTKADAYTVVNALNFFGTVASGTGALLPNSEASPVIVIYNGGANALAVYARAGETINALSTGAGFSVTNAKSAVLTPGNLGWVATLSA